MRLAMLISPTFRYALSRTKSTGIEFRKSEPASKVIQFSTVPFRRFAFSRPFGRQHRFALFQHLYPQLPAGLRLPVKRLCNRRRSAHLAESQHVNVKVTALVLYSQQVANPDLAGSLGC